MLKEVVTHSRFGPQSTHRIEPTTSENEGGSFYTILNSLDMLWSVPPYARLRIVLQGGMIMLGSQPLTRCVHIESAYCPVLLDAAFQGGREQASWDGALA